jgi:S1-C subfamily serine protease
MADQPSPVKETAAEGLRVPVVFRDLAASTAPGPGEVWLRPATGQEAESRALARLVFARGLSALQTAPCPDGVERVVVDAGSTHPTFDEMLAAHLALGLLEQRKKGEPERVPAPFQVVADYAAQVRQGKRLNKLPVEETLEGLYLAIRFPAGERLAKDDEVARQFLGHWGQLVGCLEKALAEGKDVVREGVLAEGLELFAALANLIEDPKRYRKDVRKGERWRIRLPGQKGTESGLFLRQPSSHKFADWSRQDTATPTGEPYLFLVVRWEADGEWTISTDPAHNISLEPLARLLQKEEERARRGKGIQAPAPAWYDGRDHGYTIIGSPRPGGTALSERRVLAVVRTWARARRYKDPPRPENLLLRVVVGIAIACLGLVVSRLVVPWFFPKLFQPANPYTQAAPAVVVVQAAGDLGTGFLLSADGWMVTNSHVIRAARPDPETGGWLATVSLGTLVDGQLRRLEDRVKALVFKDDPVKDLALLKLTRKPDGLASLPYLTLAPAGSPVSVGDPCYAIGHLNAGSLWVQQQGHVGKVCDFPRVNRKVILSSCALSPGDSGGPLVNQAGEVIGVSFAIPRGPLARMTYHIHLDELRAFTEGPWPANNPYAPRLPNSWPDNAGWTYQLDFINPPGDYQDAVVFSTNTGRGKFAPRGLWVDLREGKPAPDSVRKGTWAYQFALQKGRFPAAYYDTRGTGTIDLIVQAPPPKDPDALPAADVRWRRQEDQWVPEVVTEDRPLLSADWFIDEDLRQAFRKREARLQARLKEMPFCPPEAEDEQ